MRTRLLPILIVVLAGGVASAQLQPYSFDFTLRNTGSGVSDGRLRFAFDTLPANGEQYFIDNVGLTCGGGEIVANGNFSAGQGPWKFFSNAVPKATVAFGTGEAVITFGPDGNNQQLYQKDLVLPAAGAQCTLTFDACSTGGPDDPGFGHNVSLYLIKHTSPHTNYGLSLSGSPSNPEVDLLSCSSGPSCGNDNVDIGLGEECDEGGVNTETCDSDCTLPECGDGLTNPNAGEECDDGNIVDGDGCDASCQMEQMEQYCGNGQVDGVEACDNGGGTLANPLTTESDTCNRNCTAASCGDGVLNRAAGEQCDDGGNVPDDGCDANCQLDLDLGSDCEVAVCALTSQLGGEVPAFCPRFIDNLNGTVTDTDTGMVWLKDAACLGVANFDNANAMAAALGANTADGIAHEPCGLTDGSVPGDWRLPSVGCLSAAGNVTFHCGLYFATGEFSTIFGPGVCEGLLPADPRPYIPDAFGTSCWSEGDAFSRVVSDTYWSSTNIAGTIPPQGLAWFPQFFPGFVSTHPKTNFNYVWPVRDGP